MSIAERIKQGSPFQFRGPGQPCPIAVILSEVSQEDREALERELWRPPTDRHRLSAPELTQILIDEGHSLAKVSVERHRRKECRCFRGRKPEPLTP